MRIIITPLAVAALAVSCAAAAADFVGVACRSDELSCVDAEEFERQTGRAPDPLKGDVSCIDKNNRGKVAGWLDEGSCAAGLNNPGGCAAADDARGLACPVSPTDRYRCVAGEKGPAQYEASIARWLPCSVVETQREPEPPDDWLGWPDPDGDGLVEHRCGDAVGLCPALSRVLACHVDGDRPQYRNETPCLTRSGLPAAPGQQCSCDHPDGCYSDCGIAPEPEPPEAVAPPPEREPEPPEAVAPPPEPEPEPREAVAPPPEPVYTPARARRAQSSWRNL